MRVEGDPNHAYDPANAALRAYRIRVAAINVVCKMFLCCERLAQRLRRARHATRPAGRDTHLSFSDVIVPGQAFFISKYHWRQ